MSFQFPSFEPGTPGTLLDAENAKKVKAFIEAFNAFKVVNGSKNALHISDNNVVLELNVSDSGLADRVAALEALLEGYEEQELDVCDGDSMTSKTFLTK